MMFTRHLSVCSQGLVENNSNNYINNKSIKKNKIKRMFQK